MRLYAMEMCFLAYRSSLRSCRSTRDERCQPSPIYRQLPAGSLHRALADERRALMILQRTGNDLCGRGRTAVDEDDDRFALGEVLADIVTLAMRGLTKSARGLKTADDYLL